MCRLKKILDAHADAQEPGVVRLNSIGHRFAAVQTQVGHVTPQPVRFTAIGGKASEPDPAALRTKRHPLGECELSSEKHLIPHERVAEFFSITARCGGEISLDVRFIGEPGRRCYPTRIGGPRPESSVIHVRKSEADTHPNVRRKAARIIGEVEVHVAEKSMRCNAADAFDSPPRFRPPAWRTIRSIRTGDRYVLIVGRFPVRVPLLDADAVCKSIADRCATEDPPSTLERSAPAVACPTTIGARASIDSRVQRVDELIAHTGTVGSGSPENHFRRHVEANIVAQIESSSPPVPKPNQR